MLFSTFSEQSWNLDWSNFLYHFLPRLKDQMKCETILCRQCEKSVFSNMVKLYCVISADRLVYSEVSCKYHHSALNINKILFNLSFLFHPNFIKLNVFARDLIHSRNPERIRERVLKWVFTQFIHPVILTGHECAAHLRMQDLRHFNPY